MNRPTRIKLFLNIAVHCYGLANQIAGLHMYFSIKLMPIQLGVNNCSLGLFDAFIKLLSATMPPKSKRKMKLEAARATKRAKYSHSRVLKQKTLYV